MTSRAESAGLLLYRTRGDTIEVFLVHPGGPFWARKDLGAWSIPKGEPDPGEDLLAAARREFAEETGLPLGARDFRPLPGVQQRGGKRVHAWAAEADCDPARLVSNTCTIAWPPGSGRSLEIPEVDRAAWFPLPEARRRILPSQSPLLDQLERLLAA